MAWTNTAILSLVELFLYAMFIPFVAYTVYMHGRRGLLGHVYFAAYIILRLVADALLIADRNAPTGTSTTATIINSVGLSPLLLATSGFLNEAALHLFGGVQKEKNKKKLVVAFELFTHITVVTGVALLATGTSSLAKATSQSQLDKDHTRAEVGAILLLVSWVGLGICAGQIYRQSWRLRDQTSLIKLSTSLVISLPFLGARVVYAVVYAFDRSGRLSPARAPFAVELVLIFIVQFVAATVLLVGLLMSTDLGRSSQGADKLTCRAEHNEYESKDSSLQTTTSSAAK